MKRELTFILCLMLASPVLSIEFAGGTGKPNDPYQIATLEQLIAIGVDRDSSRKHYVLVADLDLNPKLPGGRVFDDALIAQDEDETDRVNRSSGIPFYGVFDGNGHSIKNLHIRGRYGHDTGLFGIMVGMVKNLHLVDVDISGSPCGAIAGSNYGLIHGCRVTGQVSGVENVGAIAGKGSSGGSIVECQAQARIMGDEEVGGIIGSSTLGHKLVRCQAEVEIKGLEIVGGLVGEGRDASIVSCMAAGKVVGIDHVGGLIGDSRRTVMWLSAADCEVTAEYKAGGLVGNTSFGGSFIDCYARGSVSGAIIGGLVGEVDESLFSNCYAACVLIPLQVEGKDQFVGGLCGHIQGPPTDSITVSCFWDADLSQTETSFGSYSQAIGQGLGTEQMQDQATFEQAGWDFDTVWTLCEGDYPQLQWEVDDCNNL